MVSKKRTFISIIIPVLNEEKTLKELISSIKDQSKIPDEVIVVDGGSSDRTVANLKSQISNLKYREKFKIITKKGNRSVGRNEAVKRSKNEIILCTDAGCILDKDWVKNITEPFKDQKIDVVSGFYKPVTKSVFEKCLAAYTCTMPDKVDPDNFLPSSRSVAFRKSAWGSLGGYPEWLDTCEDLYFARELKRKGYNFKFAEGAIVYWSQKENLKQAYIQFFNYAVGDGRALYIRPNTPFLFLRYLIAFSLIFLFIQEKIFLSFFVLWLLFVVYCIWAVVKNYRYVNNIGGFFWLPILQFTSDFAVILGMSKGMLLRLIRK